MTDPTIVLFPEGVDMGVAAVKTELVDLDNNHVQYLVTFEIDDVPGTPGRTVTESVEPIHAARIDPEDVVDNSTDLEGLELGEDTLPDLPVGY